MNRLKVTTTTAFTAAALMTTLALPGSALASRNGRRDTTLALGAVTVAALLAHKPVVAAIAGVATVIANTEANDARNRNGRWDRRGRNSGRDAGYNRYDGGYNRYDANRDAGYNRYDGSRDAGYNRYDANRDSADSRYDRGRNSSYNGYDANRNTSGNWGRSTSGSDWVANLHRNEQDRAAYDRSSNRGSSDRSRRSDWNGGHGGRNG